jgi:ribosome-interacting GTPase 1
MAWKAAGPGRKHAVELQIDKDTGAITVTKDSGMDVVLTEPKTGGIRILNPRPRIVLEKHEDGSITVQDMTDRRTNVIVKFVTDKVVVTSPAAPKEDEPDEVA